MNTENKQQAKDGKNLKLELEVKKNAKVNLEQHTFTWLLMGFVIVFATTFAVIEWTTFERQEKKEKKAQQQALDIPIDILVPFTIPEKKVHGVLKKTGQGDGVSHITLKLGGSE